MTAREFSTYCGPAVVASALEVSRMEAARRLIHAGGCDPFGGTDTRAVARVLGASRYYVLPNRPTVERWLATSRRNAILRTFYHVLHVRDGMIVEDNGHPSLRAMVCEIVYIGRQ